MIDIESEEENSLEESILEKADHIGNIITGKEKITFDYSKFLPKKKLTKQYNADLKNKLQSSINKYKQIQLSRFIGLSLMLILAISIISVIIYLLYSLFTILMSAGILGIVGFGIFSLTLSICIVLIISLKYRTK